MLRFLYTPRWGTQILALVGLVLLGLVLSSCGGPPTVAADDPARQVAEHAGWGKQVKLEFEGDKMIFRSESLPDHEMLPVYQAVSVIDSKSTYTVKPTPQKMRVEIPIHPVLAQEKTSTDIGIIGVSISGAIFYSPYEANRKTVALDANFVIDGVPFIDSCSGHPGPFGVQYHYHGIPYCITKVIDKPGEHSHMVGYLLDGFPIYGPQGAGGKFLTPADLDECNGHSGPTPEFPQGIYHYHATEQAPYIMSCYAGEVHLLPTVIRGLVQGVDIWPLDTPFFWLVVVLAVAGLIVWRRSRRAARKAAAAPPQAAGPPQPA
jgi:hypothetical protein